MPTETFITVAELGSFMERAIPGDDANAVFAVNSACKIVAGYVGRSLTEAAEVSFVNGTGRSTLNLPEWPIKEVRSVMVDDETLEPTAYAPSREGALVRLDGQVWQAGLMNVRVDYTHGWAVAEMPDDLKLVALRVARNIMVSMGETASGNIKSETIGDYSYTLADTNDDTDSMLGGPERTILNFYKRP